ncbi:MAG: DPP IV N-terminal domain-containing protein [Elusimicrobia bacterium]|nr:DPP IV N-terminal domain-containing protein [Elusimicrobiota bacterium]
MPSLLAILFVISLFSAPVAAAERTAFLVHSDKLWSASAGGDVQEVPIAFERTESDSKLGTTAPVVSPDQRRAAFAMENDLWIQDLKTGAREKVTRHGRAESDEYASVYVLVTAWSPDSKSVLYQVTHGETEDAEGHQAEKQVRPVEYGAHVYDVDKKRSRAVALAGDFQAWLPDGRVVLTSSEPELLVKALLVQKLDSDMPERLVPDRGLWGQADVSPDGRWILISLGQQGPKPADPNEEPPLVSRIVKVDVQNGKLVDVTTPGSWSEFQMPRFSPSEKQTAWIRQGEPDASGFSKAALIVDGKERGQFDLPVEYRWITDDAIAVAHLDDIDVVRASDGARIGGRKIAEPADQQSLLR